MGEVCHHLCSSSIATKNASRVDTAPSHNLYQFCVAIASPSRTFSSHGLAFSVELTPSKETVGVLLNFTTSSSFLCDGLILEKARTRFEAARLVHQKGDFQTPSFGTERVLHHAPLPHSVDRTTRRRTLLLKAAFRIVLATRMPVEMVLFCCRHWHVAMYQGNISSSRRAIAKTLVYSIGSHRRT